MPVSVVEGDLLDQDVVAIVNPWNRNTIPWWLLLPQGVSGAIKRRAGASPFKELRKAGRMQIGQAIVTSSGNLPFKGIIHVAGISDLWRASEQSIRLSVRNALAVAKEQKFSSVALPLIGAGSGSFSAEKAEAIILEELNGIQPTIEVRVVRFVRQRRVKRA